MNKQHHFSFFCSTRGNVWVSEMTVNSDIKQPCHCVLGPFKSEKKFNLVKIQICGQLRHHSPPTALHHAVFILEVRT